MNKTDLALTFAFALSSNLDNVWVGVAYGLRKVKIPFGANLVIAAVTGAGTLIAMLGGRAIGQLLTPEASGRWAGLLLLGMGGYGLISERGDEDEDGDLVRGLGLSEGQARGTLATISAGDLGFLALALSINNLVSGAAAGMAELPAGATTMLVIVLSVVTLSVGLRVGSGLARWPSGRHARILSAVLLIGLGFYEIFI